MNIRDDEMVERLYKLAKSLHNDGGYLIPKQFTNQLYWVDTPEGKLWQSRIQHWYWRLWYKITKDPIDLKNKL